MKAIVLTRGRIATVDDADFEYLNQFKWHAVKDGCTYYAVRNFRPDGAPYSARRLLYMHSVIVGIKGVDHRDGDGLNNARTNLRAASQLQNLRGHRRKVSWASSQYRGVYWNAERNKWITQVYNRGPVFRGAFEHEEEAARAYDVAATKHYGEFACLNFPPA